MKKPLSLKQITNKYGISMSRLRTILSKLKIVPRILSYEERWSFQWDGYGKRELKAEYVDTDHIESLAFQLELVRRKSQHDINEALGQMVFHFE